MERRKTRSSGKREHALREKSNEASMEGAMSINNASKTVPEAVVETAVGLRACTSGPSGVEKVVVDGGGEEGTGASKEELCVRKDANLKKRKRDGKQKVSNKDVDGCTDSDDDFVSPKEDRKVPRKVMETEVNAIQTRCSPRLLVKAMKAMNEDQKKAVRDIGFGGLLNLEISQLPSRMASWVVENFNPRNCTIRLAEGASMHISEEDVARVFGLPIGGKHIVPQKNHEPSIILKEWRAIFKKDGRKITPADICDAMLLCDKGGIWFVRHFIVLVVTLIFDSGSNGYAHPLIMNNLEEE
ncbi:unnamed protein product, partial [Cuscuta epithymum]